MSGTYDLDIDYAGLLLTTFGIDHYNIYSWLHPLSQLPISYQLLPTPPYAEGNPFHPYLRSWINPFSDDNGPDDGDCEELDLTSTS